MKTNIFVPSKINVGFQNRSGTYTGKLAYVIYFDEKGKLRKETSWQNWRDETIPNEIYDNEPTEGFVLNKKVGGAEESWGWNARRTYTRVYDPRGFEFEITVPNLLWILENCDCTKGKGLEGEFVYGWDGKDLVLVPVESPDYKEIKEKNKVIHNNEFVKAKDLIVGATYENLQGEQYVYMGKFDYWKSEYNYYHNTSWNGIQGWEKPLDETWIKDKLYDSENYRYRCRNTGKGYFFIKIGNPNGSYLDKYDKVIVFKTLNKKFSKTINKDFHEKYIEFVNMLNSDATYSPIDYNNSKIIPLPYENFKNKVQKITYYSSAKFGICEDDKLKHIDVYQNKEGKYYIIVKTKNENKRYCWENDYIDEKLYIDTIEELYKHINPVYGEYYLANGNVAKTGMYGSIERRYYYE